MNVLIYHVEEIRSLLWVKLFPSNVNDATEVNVFDAAPTVLGTEDTDPGTCLTLVPQ